MAYVTVPKDLTHVKSKVLFGLTKRQLVCFGGALLTGGPLYFLTRDYLSNSAAALLMIFAMLPGLLFALFERHGQPLEVVIQQMIQCCFIRPKERPYQTNNAYAALVRQYQMEQEVKAIVQKNDKAIYEGLASAGYSVSGGVNAPYIWLKTPGNMTSWEFFDHLLADANVVGTPGSGFGPSGEGYFRLTAFGTYENTVEAVERIKKL